MQKLFPEEPLTVDYMEKGLTVYFFQCIFCNFIEKRNE